ncbi:chromo domain-containing protein [Neoaquamicrobium sediminum]|uniref:chromo domain-containing protein n=1 Tax=Neoaquamicrobium sediminum TaxID=1849104 RepID=UPI00403654EF
MDALKRTIEDHPTYRALGYKKLLAALRSSEDPEVRAIKTRTVRDYYNAQKANQVVARPPSSVHGGVKTKPLRINARPYSYQIDVMNVGDDKHLLCVEILSRKAFAYPLDSGSARCVLAAYERFIADATADGRPVRGVTGDAFFANRAFINYNATKGIAVHTINASVMHWSPAYKGNTLGIVDRLTRTLKGMHTKMELADDPVDMRAIVATYNSATHSSLWDRTPNQVFDDEPFMNKMYIANREHNEAVAASNQRIVPLGASVRPMAPKRVFDKEGPTYDEEVYKVVGREGQRLLLERPATGLLHERAFMPGEVRVVAREVASQERDGTTQLPANHYVVERLVGARAGQYRVKWRGYPMSRCTWEPEEELRADLGDAGLQELVEKMAREGAPSNHAEPDTAKRVVLKTKRDTKKVSKPPSRKDSR